MPADFVERLAVKWLDHGCPHVRPEWEPKERCCIKAAIREALEEAEKLIPLVCGPTCIHDGCRMIRKKNAAIRVLREGR